jgi:hypothetical protein
LVVRELFFRRQEMKIHDMEQAAIKEIQTRYDDVQNPATKVLQNIMDGTLVTVTYRTAEKKEVINHVLFDRNNEPRFYRYHSEILSDLSHHKERSWFFRFLQFAGVGGLIALILVLIFSVLIFVLAFSGKPADPSITEVVKLSFTTILGFFFGQSTSRPK